MRSWRYAWTFIAAVVMGAGFTAARADERVALESDDTEGNLIAAYTRAAGLKPLKLRDGDQVRIWFDEPMAGSVTGYVVIKGQAKRCKLTTESDFEDKGENSRNDLIVHAGNCESRPEEDSRIEDAMRHLPEALEFNGQEFGCGFEDGWEARVDGVIGGQRFSFYADNTDGCKDEKIRRVDDWLTAVVGAYGKRD